MLLNVEMLDDFNESSCGLLFKLSLVSPRCGTDEAVNPASVLHNSINYLILGPVKADIASNPSPPGLPHVFDNMIYGLQTFDARCERPANYPRGPPPVVYYPEVPCSYVLIQG